eukprot:scaffold1469_cov119-Cylindrotheca_fusiformis.AAC.41
MLASADKVDNSNNILLDRRRPLNGRYNDKNRISEPLNRRILDNGSREFARIYISIANLPQLFDLVACLSLIEFLHDKAVYCSSSPGWMMISWVQP